MESAHWVGNQNEPHPQQVVILAGPHKTASSTIQYNLMRWFEDKNDTLLLQKRWSFSSPIKTFQKQGCSRALQYPYQVYYWMVRAMIRSNHTACSSNESSGKVIYEPEQMLQLYTKRFNESWSRGKSIVIATEAIDFANSIRYDGTPNQFLLRFLGLLPFTSAENITEKVTAVIMYRSPRIEHLQSMWHQHQKAQRNHNVTFSQYLENLSSYLDMLTSLDSFNLMEQCLKHGMKVILIDMSGVKRHGKDVSRVVACEVLGGDCQDGHQSGDTVQINVANKSRQDIEMDVTKDKLIQMNEAIKSYDCHFCSWLEKSRGKFAILYPSFELRRFLVKCQKHRQSSNSSAVLSLERARWDLSVELRTILRSKSSKQ